MVQASEGTGLAILKRIQESVSCAICHNLITNPVRNPCGHRFCYYCIVNALDPLENICSCPRCNAAIQRNRLVQDICFGKVVNKTSQLIDSMSGTELSEKANGGVADTSPLSKKRLPQERYENIDLDKSIEESEAEAREMARDVAETVGKGTKRTFDGLSDPISELTKRAFVVPKTSTPSGSGKERELSPFPVSFLNKFTLQLEKRPSDKAASPSPKRPREPLNRKLSFEEEKREGLMSDSSDSEDRRIRTGVTYSRFDRVRQSLKKTNAVQTEVVMFDRKDQSQQTDGTNNSDLYSTLSNLFNCLCTQHGIQGSINIEGIGRFEINLNKSTNGNVDSPDEPDQSHIAIHVDKWVQTENEEVEAQKESPQVEDVATNTSQVLLVESEVQTSVVEDDKPASPSINQTDFEGTTNASHEETNGYNGETEQSHDVCDKLETDTFGDMEVSHEVTSVSQIVKDFSEDPINSQEDSNLSNYNHIKASTRIAQADETDNIDVEATEIVSRVIETSSAKDHNITELSSDADGLEDSRASPQKPPADEDSNIIPESDEDDKFLMSCVFDTLDDNDEVESVRSLSSTDSPMRSAEIKNIYSTKQLINDSSESGENNSRAKKEEMSIDF